MPPILLDPNGFYSGSNESTEDVRRYVPGGYHPIIIGDILQSPTGPSSYRIIQKLGFGSYATVWLAQRADTLQDYVAIKVSTAQDRSVTEAKFLASINSPNIVSLIDTFDLEGPSGLHSVIVTEVLVPVLSFFSTARPIRSFKKIAYDLAKGVADLHASGLVHGDLHLSNVGIALPRFAVQHPDDVMQGLGSAEVTIVLPADPQKASRSLPAYVVTPCNMSKYYNTIVKEEVEVEAKIFDFGSAHLAGTNPTSFQCAIEACAPETAFARTVEQLDNPPIEPPADMWALGAMIYKLFYGSSLFGHWTSINNLLKKAESMASEPPSKWQGRLPDPPPADNTRYWWDERRDRLTKRCLDHKDSETLIRMLRKIFVLDPSKRPSAAEILQDDWFKDVHVTENVQGDDGSEHDVSKPQCTVQNQNAIKSIINPNACFQ